MRHLSLLTAATCLAMGVATLSGCATAEAEQNPDLFQLDPHYLWPTVWPEDGQIATGVVTGESLEQPIQYSHYTHAYVLEMQCEYCHSAARRSIHAGVPPTQTCMGCHKYVKTDRPEIQKLKAFWESGEPTPWNKVHDLPDYVYFTHKRHVRAGVDCTECHGQMQLQGMPEAIPGATDGSTTIAKVNVRETTLQMGWCLECHGSHPSIDTNYGDKADLRRAELKDCWTCHK